jgi:pullulanase/glycogen debranching enzyme
MNPVGNAGHSSPLGATVVAGGVNFSLFSRSATGVELLLFDRDDDARPARVLRLDPVTNRTYHIDPYGRGMAERPDGAWLDVSGRGALVRA